MTLRHAMGNTPDKIYENNDADIIEIRDMLGKKKTIIFPYSYDQIGAMIIMISTEFTQMSIMPFGGLIVAHKYLVGVLHRGFFHFDWRNKMYPSYASEKLGIGLPDAEGFSDLWNRLFTEDIHILPKTDEAIKNIMKKRDNAVFESCKGFVGDFSVTDKDFQIVMPGEE